MNKQGSGVFSMIINHKLAVACVAVFHLCFWSMSHNQVLYAQQGVRARDQRIKSVPGSDQRRGAGGIKPKSYKLLVNTDTVAQCKLLVTPRYNNIDTNKVHVLKLNGSVRLRLRAGKYSLGVQCSGFENYSAVVDIPPASPSLSLSLVPSSVQIVLVTKPPEAEVSIDQQPLGRSGADGSLRLPPLKIGRYQLLVRKEKHLPLFTEFEVNKDSKTLAIELKRDESTPRFESLLAALANDKLQEALESYEALARQNFDPGRLRPLVWTLIDKLNQRSSRILENVGPNGLTLSESEIASMRQMYQRAQSLLAAEAPQGDRTLALFGAFWEIKGLNATHPDTGSALDDQQSGELRSRLDQIAAFNPNNPYLMFELGYVYLRLKNVAKSERAFQDAMASKPDWAHPYFGLAVLHTSQAYAVQGDKKTFRSGLLRAAHEFEHCLIMNPRLIHAYVLASFCYADAAEAKSAIKIGLQGFAMAPESGLVKYALGYAYFVSGRKDYAPARFYLSAALSATKEPLDSVQAARANEILNRIGAQRK
ncbi:MAG TPA: PEGA domain-containing protein [Pyrinomonadaceae bacterium]|jgi:tetratricopeptide (TPR) repeat protein|nr:PEGA domain-containing protein [Pyrinomonadaceae bacterium]